MHCLAERIPSSEFLRPGSSIWSECAFLIKWLRIGFSCFRWVEDFVQFHIHKDVSTQ